MRTIIYARFSSDLQNPKSCEDQLAELTRHCQHEGWEIVGTYADEEARGADGINERARPGIHSLLKHLENGGVEQVLAEATNRIARHPGDLHKIYEMITFVGARLFTTAQGEITEVTAAIHGLMDAEHSRTTGHHVRRGQAGSVRDGRSPCGVAYGYATANTIAANGRPLRGLRIIDSAKAAIVGRIFTEYSQGISPRSIAERLNSEDIPGPRGGRWKSSTIAGDKKRKNGILNNRIYIGKLIIRRTKKVRHPTTRKYVIQVIEEKDWIIQEKADLRIIPDELWEAVQTRRLKFEGQHFRTQRRPKQLLSGLGVCSTCGGQWVVIGRDRWGCTNFRNGHGCVNNRSITTEWYEKRVLGGLQDRMLDPVLLSAFVKEYHAEYARRAADQNRQRNRLEKRRLDAANRIANLVEAIADDGYTKELKDALAKAKIEQARIESDVMELEAIPVVALHPGIAESYRKHVRDLAKALSQDGENRFQAHNIVRGLIDRVTVTPSSRKRGVNIEVSGRLATILSLASGKPVPANMYVGDGAGSGNRTRIASLEGWSFTTKLYPHLQGFMP